ncbi:uncharacterized protein LOC135847732 isoform X1 [Planococcus citri]|uniref:uncharacterized protein LOC135847732 isoform X1 n=1 Tax=Planococcus citri TaxID=170843 RepID=UPI0031F81EBA
MEVQPYQERHELEMAEDTSTVYDIIHPTPVSLKQLSAIVISLEIWRCKVNEYRTSRKLREFDPYRLREENTWIKTMLPELHIPSTTYKMIEEVFSKFGHSIKWWRIHHYKSGFCFQYSHENYVLKDFDDFVCDYDGSIHYLRTAERMMHCEAFNSEMKFMIACMYFFEDDIRRIWPSVSNNVNIDFIRFRECPQLYYWICLLTNEIPPTWRAEGEITVDERMFGASMPFNRPSVEYFWNRIPFEKHMLRGMREICRFDFVRFILPKMDDQQLDTLLNEWLYGVDDSLYWLFLFLHCDEWIVLRTWLHIRNILEEYTFSNFFLRMLEIMYNHVVPAGRYEWVKWSEFHDQEKWEYLCCQIWNHTPLNLKQSAIRRISSDDKWFEEIRVNIPGRGCDDSNKMHVKFLLLVLQDASLKERSSFWHNCWGTLIKVVRTEDLQRMVQLCFENNDEISQFKQNVMINNGVMFGFCVRLLENAFFHKLNALVSFCCPESQAARNLKQLILQSAFLEGDCEFSRGIVDRSGYLNEFVNDAFDDVDVCSEFKNLLMSSSSVMKRLASIICSHEANVSIICSNEGMVTLTNLTEFIDAFVSTEEALTQVKMSLIDSLKEYATARPSRFRDYVLLQDEFNSILLWCLGNNERVEEFKRSSTS